MFRMLANFYGTDNIAFEVRSDEFNGVTADSAGNVRPVVTRRYESFSEAAQENARARIFLGIHWQFDADAGVAQGSVVADHVFGSLLNPLQDASTPTSENSRGNRRRGGNQTRRR